MILMGDEVRRTQHGNNNCYCHDSEISWFDWSLVEKHADIKRFTKLIIKQRLIRDSTREEFSMSLLQLMDRNLITWHGVKLGSPDWSDNSHSLAFSVRSLSGKLFMHFMLNAYCESLAFELPVTIGDRTCRWKRWLDTSLESPDDISEISEVPEVSEKVYRLCPYSIAILIELI
jgi:glycogen operon protein